MSKGKTIAAGAGLAAVLALAAPLIQKYEGYKHEVYFDVVGVATVCWGHTGPDVVPGRKYSLAECEKFLRDDMAEANAHVNRCIPGPKPLSVEAALTSFIFNLGPGPLCYPDRTPRKWALRGDWPKLCASLDAYKFAGGRVYRGLVLRRADERKLCERDL
jgi:lysozyme